MQMPYLTKRQGERIETEYTALSARALAEEGGRVRLVMNKWTAVNHDASGRVTFASAENDVSIDLPLDEIFKPEKRSDNLSMANLWKEIKHETNERRKRSMLTAYYSRVAQSLAPLCLVLMAVPVGVVVRRGSRLAGLGAALPPLLLYMVTFLAFRGMGDSGGVPPQVAAFVPDALLLVIGGFLLWGMSRK